MPRKPRIEFEGAIYHVVQRGGPRRPVFGGAEAARAFEACLFQACDRLGWRLHAYTLLPDGFHIVLETPRGNLVAGMRWLLSTFALRRRRNGKEHGRRYLRRYRAVLIEPGPPLGAVSSFVHIAPARAGILAAESLPNFRWGSVRRMSGGERPGCLVCRDWLRESGGFPDTPEGWAGYHGYLVRLAGDPAEQQRLGFGRMGRGWAVGSAVWRGHVARRHPGHTPAKTREAEWAQTLETLLTEAGRTRADATAAPKGADWKIGIAGQMRRMTAATNDWIARELSMGTGSSVSVYLTRR